MIKDFIARLTSRVFLMSAIAFGIFVYVGQYEEAMGVVLAFTGMERLRDMVGAETITTAVRKVSKKTGALPDTYEVDSGEIITGRVQAPTEAKDDK